jgi:phenylalanyl-tRNA synthetase beta chain
MDVTMLVPLSWLRDFAPFGDDFVALGETFDDLGMVVEAIRQVGAGLEGVVVARVLSIEAIPKADKIRKVMADVGRADPVQVVCGAWNFDVGDLVPWVQPGSTLPNGFEIGSRKMRGVDSAGMLCSPTELELGVEAGGLMVLPKAPGFEPGRPFAEAMGIERDVVFDLAIETNRPDAMCVAGVARDTAARLKLPFAIPAPNPVQGSPAAALASVERLDLCPRFSATVFTGARVEPSPPWIASRLTVAGMRPISNLVDASNYVMLELGQPTHPYDLDRLPGGGLLVRAATPGERLTTLDGVERTLGDSPYPDCLICDAEGRPVGIAGIMGGASSEISETTTTVLLEAAYFDRMTIARTSRRIGLRSEASARFERGCDPEGLERAVARFGELVGLSASQSAMVGEAPPRRVIKLRTDRVNAVLGTDLDDRRIRGYLAPIGFESEPAGDGAATVTVPSFRPDAEEEIDLVEEVARHHGYANIGRTIPATARIGGLTTYQRERRFVADVLVGAGLSEAVTSLLVGPGDHERAGFSEEGLIEADSPLAKEESLLRSTLLPGLLKTVAFNVSRQNPDVAFFEIGHVFGPPLKGEQLPDEHERLAVAIAGADATAAVELWWTLADALRLDGVSLQASPHRGLHPTRTALIVAGPERRAMGVVGEIDPDVLAAHDIPGRVAYMGADMTWLLEEIPRRPDAMAPISRFPASDIDLAFETPDAVPAAGVADALRAAAGEVLEDLKLFDVYRSDLLGHGVRSLAYRLRFRSLDHTLTLDEVGEVRRRCIEAAQALGARLRA